MTESTLSHTLPRPWQNNFKFINYTKLIDGYIEFKMKKGWVWPEEIHEALIDGQYTYSEKEPSESNLGYKMYKRHDVDRGSEGTRRTVMFSKSYPDYLPLVFIKLESSPKIVSDDKIQDRILAYLWEKHEESFVAGRHVCAEDIGRGGEPSWKNLDWVARQFQRMTR